MIEVPEALANSQRKYGGEAGRAFIEVLPQRAVEFLERWQLRVTGPAMHGMAALVLPVERPDGTSAALKLQALDEESEGEPVALRIWDGDGAVRLLDHDADTNTLLLERLDSGRPLSALADQREAVRILAELLARLTAGPAPEGMRTLKDIAAGMLADVPDAVQPLRDDRRRVLLDCAAAVREVADESGDRLLHWDLHYDNVLGAEREDWLVIDPRPLAGDPGFDLMPALDNLFDPAETKWRFDLLTETLDLDRERARAWVLGRVLQNSLWSIEDGESDLEDEQLSIARTLLAR
ncbi:aminoglycoside phosphotransferase family protein [Streptomyces sp. NBC_00690]|uniref:aminoglycoside phosphotransferase family protein n=1 Tax=Streptomyces sp. NBC_00690 TaxID=2975808 RepID=UPI002E29081F|nr:aminoglycoside phosphotransferase family protein [Streptomyces sp. NBC_00690]